MHLSCSPRPHPKLSSRLRTSCEQPEWAKRGRSKHSFGSACALFTLVENVEAGLAKGISADAIRASADARLAREMAARKAIAEQAERDRIQRMNTANRDPGASYYPGQWESAIRNAGNAAVDAINPSSDSWLQQRRDQYVADWQRSQRAY